MSRAEYRKKWREDNKEKIIQYNKEYWKNNKEKLSEKAKEYYVENKDIIKERSKNYIRSDEQKEKIKEYKKEYWKENKEEIKENRKEYFIEYRKNNKKKYILSDEQKEAKKVYRREYQNKRLKDPLYKLKSNISSSIRQSLKERFFKKNKKTIDILGCSIEFFQEYIEKQMKDWMNWENHGKYNGELDFGWDLDHIIPISSANSEEDVYKLNHYTNFQPLCSKVNRDIKKDKI